MLARLGFCSVTPESHSLRVQVSMWSSARIVAGATGAAWTNLLFAGAQTLTGLIWCPSAFRDSPVFSNLAHISGVKLRYHIL